jgi:hypothetical protein
MYDVQDSNRELTRRLIGCGLDLLFCLCRRASHLYTALSVRWAWPCSASASVYVQPIRTTCRTATMSSVRRLAGWGPSSSTTQTLQSRTRHASAQHLPHSTFLQCTYNRRPVLNASGRILVLGTLASVCRPAFCLSGHHPSGPSGLHCMLLAGGDCCVCQV